MRENAIISLSDSNYFELLNEQIDSIKRFKQSKDFSICIMDAGLEENQIEILQKKVADKYGYRLVDHKLELYGIKKK